MKKFRIIISYLLFFFTCFPVIKAQMITGIWKGKINKQKVEVKIIQKGSSLTGTTYYYESSQNYLRYSIKGYFDAGTNEVVWWDDELIEKTGATSSNAKEPLISRADFNCPGYGRMILGGKASKVDNQKVRAGEVNLDKTEGSDFTDEWDFVLENFTVGANDPEIIDSVELIAVAKKPVEELPAKPLVKEEPLILTPTGQGRKDIRLPNSVPGNTITPVEPIKPISIAEKYFSRKKDFATEIPVSGDSIELHFYDNAQVDGDSISLFLNDKLIFEHIRLTDKAYIIKLAVTALNASNELIMVAENLGSIPPNTSYMVASVGDQRFESRLQSTEGSSAMIRLVRR